MIHYLLINLFVNPAILLQHVKLINRKVKEIVLSPKSNLY